MGKYFNPIPIGGGGGRLQRQVLLRMLNVFAYPIQEVRILRSPCPIVQTD